MEENVRLLMEETGCDQGEAELALELANHDLENAIRTIESLLRHIFALKAKFYFPELNRYGLLLAVVNTKTRAVLRFHTVVSYNPTLYENSPQMDWYDLEKLIFSYRLDEGSIPDFTQELEQKLSVHLSEQSAIVTKGDKEEMTRLLVAFFKPDIIHIELEVEELNLAQFRKLPIDELLPVSKRSISESESGAVWLKVNFFEDENGKNIALLAEGDVVLAQITDTRDIAHYLAHLIGSKRGDDIMPLPAVIKKISEDNGEVEVQVYFAPGIVGINRAKNNLKIKVLEEKNQPWWKKIIPWS